VELLYSVEYFPTFSADAALNESIPESLGNFFQNLKIKDHYYLKTELDLTFWYEYCCLKMQILMAMLRENLIGAS
jgi:hypothetical protein